VLCESVLGQGLLQFARKEKRELENCKAYLFPYLPEIHTSKGSKKGVYYNPY
jgi:hypothetical protein